MGDYDGAIEDYTRALQRDAGDVVLFVERGKANLAFKRYGPALEDFKAAVHRDGALKNSLGPLMAECEAALHPKKE